MDKIDNINKFSFAQMTSNESGKTSGSGTMGILIVTCACIVLLYGAFIKNTEVLLAASGALTLGAGLLGYRKSQDTNIISNKDGE